MNPKRVKVTKLEALPGRPNGLGVGEEITSGYFIIGDEEYPPKVGNSYIVERYERNGVVVYGEFWTSEVKKVDNVDEKTTIITTRNSIYKIETL